jgi:hypothetical protein
MIRFPRALVTLCTAAVLALAACGSDDDGIVDNTPPAPTPTKLTVSGKGTITSRYTGEVWVQGNYAYTTTWGSRIVAGASTPGNRVYVWDVRNATPVLVDSLAVAAATTVGDVQVSSDGKYLVVPTEPGPGSLVTYDLTDPAHPRLVSTFTSPKITAGIHTTEIQTIGGRLTAFLSINPGSHPARLMIVDLGDATAPRELFTLDITSSFIHDVFVRDGVLFTAQWDNGMVIHDIGGGGRGGTLQAPVQIGTVATAGGNVHNIWWFHDPSSGSKRYAFVGEEGPATGFASSSGDIHVVDVSTMSAPREVAFYNVPGAGTHNFSMDEANGFLYAAYYNAGVQVLDVRGDLSVCTAAQKASDGRCNLGLMGRARSVGLLDQGSPVYIWGVQLANGSVWASDMLSGLWRLAPASR